jgi:hypothetical protein
VQPPTEQSPPLHDCPDGHWPQVSTLPQPSGVSPHCTPALAQVVGVQPFVPAPPAVPVLPLLPAFDALPLAPLWPAAPAVAPVLPAAPAVAPVLPAAPLLPD